MASLLPEENPSSGAEGFPEKASDFSGSTQLFQDKELERLRQMLFARELALLEQVAKNQEAKQFNTKKVSEVLAESIILRTEKDRQLTMALEPVVDDILKTCLRRRREDFINLLFPLMGPVIRKSMTETFLSMLGNFSQSVEMAFSWQGLRWRFESWRSGKPFSEIVLLHTLVYRVEQVFFIHSETGIALSHIVNEEAFSQDVDMVSGMLTAIQDFAQDSFSREKDRCLDSVQMGDLVLIIEKTNVAYIACVLRGTPPANFRTLLQETLELMLVEYAEPLANFSGDTSPFLTAVRYLQPLLLSHYKEKEKKIPVWAKAVPIVCLVGFLSWGSYVWYAKFTRNQVLGKAVLSFNGHPGIIVTNVMKHKHAPWEVLIFRDALAPYPEEILQKKGFPPNLLTLKTVPFLSYDSSIILRRVKYAVSPPDTVNLRLRDDGTLVLSGKAPMAWIVKSRDAVMSIPGVKRVDTSGLYDPLMNQVMALVKEINGTKIEFPLGKDTPVARDLPKLEKAVENLVLLGEIAQKNDLAVSLTVYGHADTIGSQKKNYEISLARTKAIAIRLYAKGTTIPISLYGMGSEFSKKDSQKGKDDLYSGDQASRRIELRVALSRAIAPDISLKPDKRIPEDRN